MTTRTKAKSMWLRRSKCTGLQHLLRGLHQRCVCRVCRVRVWLQTSRRTNRIHGRCSRTCSSKMISFQTGLKRALETATIAATAAREVQQMQPKGTGRPSGPRETASVPNVRYGQSTARIHPTKELHDEALTYFEKRASLH